VEQLADWLRHIPDEVPLHSIPVIPGTHNSATARPLNRITSALPWMWAKCQDKTISEQLMLGVRSLDLRVVCQGNELPQPNHETDASSVVLRISHAWHADETMRSVVDAVLKFLDRHPTEFVIIRFKRDWAHRHRWNSLAQTALQNLLASVPHTRRAPRTCTSRSALGEVRNRIIFACPDSALGQCPTSGAFWNRLDVWNAGTYKRACGLVHRYGALHDRDKDASQRGHLRSAGANVLVGVLTPRTTSARMNRWLLELLNSSSPKVGGSALRTAPNVLSGGLHFGVLVVDFIDKHLAAAMVACNTSLMRKPTRKPEPVRDIE